ncbi:hypothetical protein ACT7C1_24485 [Bacillus paranthracis]
MITFGVISLVTWIGTAIELHLLATHTYDLYEYTTNHVVSDELKMVSLLGVVIIVLLAIWTFFLLFIFLKIMFPNKKIMARSSMYGGIQIFERDAGCTKEGAR